MSKKTIHLAKHLYIIQETIQHLIHHGLEFEKKSKTTSKH